EDLRQSTGDGAVTEELLGDAVDIQPETRRVDEELPIFDEREGALVSAGPLPDFLLVEHQGRNGVVVAQETVAVIVRHPLGAAVAEHLDVAAYEVSFAFRDLLDALGHEGRKRQIVAVEGADK